MVECGPCSQVLRSWWINPHISESGLTNSVTHENHFVGQKAELSTSPSFPGAFILAIHLCRNKLEWMITTEPELDITPIATTFKDLLYNPYSCAPDVLNLLDDVKGTMSVVSFKSESALQASIFKAIETISQRLLASIIQHQSSVIKEYTARSSSLEFEIGMISSIKNSVTSVWKNEKDSGYVIGIEFPLFQAVTLSRGDEVANKFVDHIRAAAPSKDPLQFCRLLKSSIRGAIKTDDKLSIPTSLLACSAQMEFDGVSVNGRHKSSTTSTDASMFDKCTTVIQKMAEKWAVRKEFIEELSRVAAVLEFDAVDFSYVVIAVRIKRGQLCTLCTVDYRLQATFPETKPLMSTFDLQTGTSTVLDSSSGHKDGSYSPTASIEKLAEECLSIAANFITQHAFTE
jgi:hypothetical protein